MIECFLGKRPSAITQKHVIEGVTVLLRYDAMLRNALGARLYHLTVNLTAMIVVEEAGQRCQCFSVPQSLSSSCCCQCVGTDPCSAQGNDLGWQMTPSKTYAIQSLPGMPRDNLEHALLRSGCSGIVILQYIQCVMYQEEILMAWTETQSIKGDPASCVAIPKFLVTAVLQVRLWLLETSGRTSKSSSFSTGSSRL